jgi:hypothetical protein
MQEKSKIYNIHAKARTPPQTKPYGWQTPIFPRKSANREELRGLVKISVNCLSVTMYLISMSPFSTWSLKKWCLLSTCLIFLWKTKFLATEMALVLSHMRGTLSKTTPKSLMVCTIQRICEQQLAAATYSASGVDCATEDCLREDQQTREDLKNDKCQKYSFDQSHNPQNQHRKSQQDPAKKKHNTKCQTQECV